MELKLNWCIVFLFSEKLLIVPYGIETDVDWIGSKGRNTFNCTLWNWNSDLTSSITLTPFLLIVPYGIETQFHSVAIDSHFLLLIVPYGIETSIIWSSRKNSLSFNCTLWNWNKDIPVVYGHNYHLLIVPYELLTPLERDENAVLRSRPIRLPCT